jgi:hypothetical protein
MALRDDLVLACEAQRRANAERCKRGKLHRFERLRGREQVRVELVEAPLIDGGELQEPVPLPLLPQRCRQALARALLQDTQQEGPQL